MRFGLMAAAAACVVAAPANALTPLASGTFTQGAQTASFSFFPSTNTTYRVTFSKPLSGSVEAIAQAYFYEDGTDPSGANNFDLRAGGQFADAQSLQFDYLIDTVDDGFSVYFDPGRFTITVNDVPASGARWAVSYFTAGAVPEPATWVLMILGFGAVGGALRRRKADYGATCSR